METENGERGNVVESAGRLEEQSRLVIDLVQQPREWSTEMHTGTFAVTAHAAYHLGAVRQVLRQLAQ